jgi:hypothetical protein
VKIIIGRGEAQREFVIHESILDARTSLFREALSWRRTQMESDKRFHCSQTEMAFQSQKRNTLGQQRVGPQNPNEVAEFRDDKQVIADEDEHPGHFHRRPQSQHSSAQEQRTEVNGRLWEDLLCFHNHYNEEQDVFCFRNQSASAFAIYQQLIYTGQIAICPPYVEEVKASAAKSDDPITTDSVQSQCTGLDLNDYEFQALCSLYLLADYFQDVEAKTAATKAIVSKCAYEHAQLSQNCLPSAAAIRIIYERTKGHCAGRQALVDCFVYYGAQIYFDMARKSQNGSYPREFFVDLAGSSMAVRARPDKG